MKYNIQTIVSLIVRKFVRMRGVNRLISRGLVVGKNFSFEKGMLIDKIYPHLITIGDDVIFSADVKVLAHDAGLKNILGLVRIGRVSIGNRVFVGLGTIILPNVRIGDDVIVGAGSVVCKNIPSGCVCAGIPAKVICSMEEYKARILNMAHTAPIYENTLNPLLMTEIEKEQQKNELQYGIGIKKAVNYNEFNSLENIITHNNCK